MTAQRGHASSVRELALNGKIIPAVQELMKLTGVSWPKQAPARQPV